MNKEPLNQQESTAMVKGKEGALEKRGVKKEETPEDSDEEVEGEDVDDDNDDESSDDPDRLWCICQQPHDDR